MKLVELSCFTSTPLGPSVKSLELTTSKAAKSTFGVGNGFGLKGREQEFDLFVGDVVTIDGRIGMESVDGAQCGRSDAKFIIRVIGCEMMRVKQVKFFLGSGAMATGWQWFGSKRERERSCQERVSRHGVNEICAWHR
jgi:hypothetical protein